MFYQWFVFRGTLIFLGTHFLIGKRTPSCTSCQSYTDLRTFQFIQFPSFRREHFTLNSTPDEVLTATCFRLLLRRTLREEYNRDTIVSSSKPLHGLSSPRTLEFVRHLIFLFRFATTSYFFRIHRGSQASPTLYILLILRGVSLCHGIAQAVQGASQYRSYLPILAGTDRSVEVLSTKYVTLLFRPTHSLYDMPPSAAPVRFHSFALFLMKIVGYLWYPGSAPFPCMTRFGFCIKQIVLLLYTTPLPPNCVQIHTLPEIVLLRRKSKR